MIYKSDKIIFSILIVCITILFCTSKKNSIDPTIFVSIIPHKYLVEKIVENKFKVYSLIEPGQDSHNYTPTPLQMKKLSYAKLFFAAGVEYENTVIPKIKNTANNIKIISLQNNIKLIDAVAHNCPELKNHDHHHHNSKNIKDPHTWLSPTNAKIQAKTILTNLILIDSSNKKIYQNNYDVLSNQIDSLGIYLHTILDELKGSNIFVYHPAFGYFAKEYGLKQIAVETGGKEPSAKAMVKLIELAKFFNPKVIFVQPQYSKKSAEIIADQIGCVVVSINPLPVDYIMEMKKMGEKIKMGLKK